jgi:flagellar protein FlbB
MAREKKKAAAVEEEEKQGYSTFQWIIFVVFIPLLFAMTIALIVMTIAGVNIFEKTKEVAGTIPYVSEWIGTDDIKQDGKKDEEKVVELQADIKNKEAEIGSLQGKLTDSETKIEGLLTEQDRLNAELKQLQQQQKEGLDQAETAKKDTDTVVKTYETMGAKNIAGIIVNMTNAEAVNILKQLSIEKQADVLETLPAETAAEYTKLLSNG